MVLQKLKKIVQKVASNPLVRATRRNGTRATTTTFSSTYALSVPYHWAAFVNFMREQRSVMAGKKQYYKNLNVEVTSNALLRRNVHRLEKGLTMQPLRDVFAENYIFETTQIYSQTQTRYLNSKESVDVDELTWANNVLKQYFDTVIETKKILKAKTLFEDCKFSPEETDSIPYQRGEQINLPSYEQILSLSKYRRSVRWFLDKPVERTLIDQALVVAREAPSACNRLPYEFRIFDKPNLVSKISNLPFGTTGYADNIPVIAVLVGRLDNYFSARDRHAIYIDTSLAAMSFAFALETLGLSSCMINWPDFEPLERKMAKTLNLKQYERPIMLMAIGYPDPIALVANSKKKSLDTIRSYNKTK